MTSGAVNRPGLRGELQTLETRVESCRRNKVPVKPRWRRYSPEGKAAAVRMVRALRTVLRPERGTVGRVAHQPGYGIDSVRGVETKILSGA